LIQSTTLINGVPLKVVDGYEYVWLRLPPLTLHNCIYYMHSVNVCLYKVTIVWLTVSIQFLLVETNFS